MQRSAIPISHPSRPPFNFSPAIPIPSSLPNLQPSYPATLFGGVSADDEHVTVWHPETAKTVAGNAAPYRRNLSAWLAAHPGWEEKSDDLKSSKRRTAARRSRAAADAFAAMCCYPAAVALASDAAHFLVSLSGGDHLTEHHLAAWQPDDFVRLQEALFHLAQKLHASDISHLSPDRWSNVCTQVGGSKRLPTLVSCAHHMLSRGIMKSRAELGLPNFTASAPTSPAGSPASLASLELPAAFGSSSVPNVGIGAQALEKSFRTPRQPRVTVWNPSNGRTISGNAAPCRRNLDAWMKLHPGWVPKEEGQLSSSRRNRNKKSKSVPVPIPVPHSGTVRDALDGLLCLSRSPMGYSPLVERMNAMAVDDNCVNKMAGSTVSSSSGDISEDDVDDDDDELSDDDDDMEL